MQNLNERITARSTPPISKKNQPKFLSPERKQQLAEAFLKLGSSYDRLRPEYPGAIIKQLIAGSSLKPGSQVADLGAGTGKLSFSLAQAGFKVTAIDPSAQMLQQIKAHPNLQIKQASAEYTNLPDSSQKLVTAAQAWHWFETEAANREVKRILQTGGYLALIWNNLNVSVPWVHRYSRIAHSGDVLKADHNPPVAPEFQLVAKQIHHWEDERAVEDFIQMALTRSYGATASAERQAKIIDNLKWYFYEHLAHSPNSLIKMPYRTDLYLYQLAEAKTA